MRTFTITQDGAVLATGLTEIQVARWFNRHVGFSMDYALRYQGYRVEEEGPMRAATHLPWVEEEGR